MVIGRIPQKEMTAREIAERMDKGNGLELVDVIRCTDPRDPYPYIAGGPGQAEIVKHGNLVYREAGPGGKERWIDPSSFFMYKVKIKHRDEPHFFVLEYPDDRERWIEFSIMAGKGKDPWTIARTSTGAICGGRWPLSNQLRKLWLLYYPAGTLVSSLGAGHPFRGKSIGGFADKRSIVGNGSGVSCVLSGSSVAASWRYSPLQRSERQAGWRLDQTC